MYIHFLFIFHISLQDLRGLSARWARWAVVAARGVQTLAPARHHEHVEFLAWIRGSSLEDVAQFTPKSSRSRYPTICYSLSIEIEEVDLGRVPCTAVG